MAVDWLKIKTEYINGNVSQRDLAAKYGVTLRQISNHATAEQWVLERQNHLDKLSTEIQRKADEKTIESESEIIAIKSRMKLKIFRQLEKSMETADDMDGQDFRRLVQNYKDMCDIHDSDDGNGKENGMLADLIDGLKDEE